MYPFGGEILAAYSRTKKIGTKLRALPFLLTRRGDEEAVVTFHAEHLADVLRVLKPYRRREVTEAERERLRAIGAAHLFGPGDGVESDFPAPESTGTVG